MWEAKGGGSSELDEYSLGDCMLMTNTKPLEVYGYMNVKRLIRTTPPQLAIFTCGMGGLG